MSGVNVNVFGVVLTALGFAAAMWGIFGSTRVSIAAGGMLLAAMAAALLIDVEVDE